MRNVVKITPERFNAFVDWTRAPAVDFVSEELEWYADKFERVLGVVLLDTVDNDFAYIILGRDEALRFRCIDLRVSMPNIGMARSRLKVALQKFSQKGKDIFPQGGERHKPIDIFAPVVPEEKMHPQFKSFMGYPNWTPAIGIMKEMMRHFPDIDGNFVQQFQTTGFDARLWELYIYAYLKEERLFFDREYHAPDYVVQKYGHTVCIEAVTVNSSDGHNKLINDKEPLKIRSEDEIRDLLKDYMPIKFGSSLYSKLSRNPPYWKMDHVNGNPLVFAIADFHEAQSMLWSSTALMEYLYGVHHDFSIDADGQLVISPLKIEKHKLGEKEIPSGFFFLPDAENVSAVLFSNSGTISKFNRMGRLAGFGVENLKIMRMGTCHNHDPNAALPKRFFFEIEPGNVTETWGEGLSMFHNPNALHPVPKDMFPSIAHHEYRDGQVYSVLPEFHPYSSITMNMNIVEDDDNDIAMKRK